MSLFSFGLGKLGGSGQTIIVSGSPSSDISQSLSSNLSEVLSSNILDVGIATEFDASFSSNLQMQTLTSEVTE
jgi:hypothetical protein